MPRFGAKARFTPASIVSVVPFLQNKAGRLRVNNSCVVAFNVNDVNNELEPLFQCTKIWYFFYKIR